MPDTSTDIVLSKINGALAYLAEAKTILEVKQVIALADAASVYAKQIGATVETQNYAGAVRLRAERRLGEILLKTPMNQGNAGKGRPKKGGSKREPPNGTPTLAESGITKKLSSRAQELASVPAAKFEAALQIGPGKELNHNRILKKLTETRQKKERDQKRQAAADDVKDDRIIVGDFRERADLVAYGSVSLIFTDPPYDKKASKMLPDLGAFAAAKLCEGGSLLCYVGQTQIPAAMDAFREHLRYWWVVACIHSGKSTVMREYGINAGWKAVLWFVKGTRHDNSVMVSDVMSGGQEKAHHDWQQAESEAAYWIEKLCPDDGLVCDPFLGGGTTAAAAKSLGRRWVGFEIDDGTARVAGKRVR